MAAPDPLTTDQKGAIAEAAITAAAVRLGLDVYVPLFGAQARHDLVLGSGRRLLRVQCKWASRRGDVVLVRCYSSRRARDGLRWMRYTSDDTDVIAAYCADVDRAYLIEPARFTEHSVTRLRLAPCRNNQRRGVLWADDFDLAARLGALLGP